MAGYMMHKYCISLNDALNIIKEKKPNADPNIGFLGQLKKFEKTLNQASNLESQDGETDFL